jgi:hypothetical protein
MGYKVRVGAVEALQGWHRDAGEAVKLGCVEAHAATYDAINR